MQKRLFVGSDTPKTLVEDFLAYQKTLSITEARWTTEENYHLTVAFLGYVRDEHIGKVEQEVAEIAATTKPFALHYEASVLAPPGKDATMIWAKLAPSDPYADLVSKIYANVGSYITENTRTERIPHITLARFREGYHINEENLIQPQLRERSFDVDEISLFETKPTHEGSEYTKFSTFRLEGK